MNFTVKLKSLNPLGTVSDYMTIQYQYRNSFYDKDNYIGTPVALAQYNIYTTIPNNITRKFLVDGEKLYLRMILYVDGKNEFQGVEPVALMPTCIKPDGT